MNDGTFYFSTIDTTQQPLYRGYLAYRHDKLVFKLTQEIGWELDPRNYFGIPSFGDRGKAIIMELTTKSLDLEFLTEWKVLVAKNMHSLVETKLLLQTKDDTFIGVLVNAQTLAGKNENEKNHYFIFGNRSLGITKGVFCGSRHHGKIIIEARNLPLVLKMITADKKFNQS
jgi:hypothetical protein